MTPPNSNPQNPNAQNPNAQNPDGEYRFSYGRFVLYVLGSGVLVLLVSIPVILGLARWWTPVAGLIAAILAVIVMIAVIGTVARRQLADAERQITAQRDRDATGREYRGGAY